MLLELNFSRLEKYDPMQVIAASTAVAARAAGVEGETGTSMSSAP
ncbi:MAG TPA: hypothetical protein VNA04_02945 [Thermoanaerobaculia bacterium]|nr:hypothetical protein [Thermoanaerobaculia bacterium]